MSGQSVWRQYVSGLVAICLFIPTVHAAAEQQRNSDKPVIAVFDLTGELTEQPADESLIFMGAPAPSLRDVVGRMKKATDDANVKAVVINCDGASFGLAQAEELREAMHKLRQAGKEVYAHSDSMMLGQYVLLSGASRLSVVPTGDLWITGLYGDQPYLRGLLDKLGVVPDILHCGAYKSAGEMFMRNGPSPEADQMTNWLLDSIYDTAIKQIADGRNVSPEKVRQWIDNGPYTAEKAKAAGLIDAVEHHDAFEAMLKKKYGSEVTFEKQYGAPKPPQLDMSNPFALVRTFAELMGGPKAATHNKPAVGVVYVDGMILLGKGEASLFGSSAAMSTDISRAIEQAARDDSIKAVVLRIDSPGGSAVASEIILGATQRLKERKPLVVSMGDVAGSGGYYVTCAADTIFADDSTITASIGVVGGKFVTTDMWNKIGVTWKAYQRGAHAGLLSSDTDFTPEERQRLQSWLDDIYGVFKGHVVAIRGDRLKKPIDELAAGRVFTGRQALDLGLVDKIGTLQDAIEFAAGKAALKDYDVRTVPEPKNILQRLMEQAGGDNDPNHLVTRGSLLDLAAPYLKDLDPQRVRAIRRALGQLQLMQKEGVILMMPPALTQ
jgi:protease-4